MGPAPLGIAASADRSTDRSGQLNVTAGTQRICGLGAAEVSLFGLTRWLFDGALLVLADKEGPMTIDIRRARPAGETIASPGSPESNQEDADSGSSFHCNCKSLSFLFK
jgi:hypothetical protein